jgi:hypothetical protein
MIRTMLDFRQPRVAAPIAHALVFALTWFLFWLQPQPLLDGPAALPFAIAFFADLPFSAIAFGVMFTSDAHCPYAVTAWGIVGTFWWYFLGGLINRRRRRWLQ